MFCNECGAQLQAGQQRCVRCGKLVVGGVEYRRSRVQEHVRLLGIFWMAYSALNAVAGVVLVVIANTLFGHAIQFNGGPPPQVTSWLSPFLTVIGGLILVKAAAGFIAGWGLLQHEPWARIVTLVVGFIALFNVPIGTALGVYTLWVLMSAQSDEDYRALSQAA